ncbi:MAG TPA: purine-nucleoside phosphorylase [Bacteroidales bacterium]|nr:purine-nucleoside phosphorylase [Bacteroidales bacterium]
MSVHNEAKQGEVAESILIAGDPLRAKYIAENYLTEIVCYNEVRNMLGYTGLYKGKRLSVQGSGMGMPSMTIYAHELINEYNAKQIMRIGTCGSFQPDVKIRDLILAQGASTDSAMNKQVFGSADFAPLANFELLKNASNLAQESNMNVHVGNILSSDIFYADIAPIEYYKKWIAHGILAVEMETAALYTLGAKFGVDTLSVLTVSDNLVTGEHASPEEREKSFDQMMKLALELA